MRHRDRSDDPANLRCTCCSSQSVMIHARPGPSTLSDVEGPPKRLSSGHERAEESCQDVGIDRGSLPIRRPPFAGATERTLEGSQPDWNQASHVQPPEGAPNVLLVLIDDAGFGNPSTFGGPIQTPELHAARGERAALQPLPRHGALLADQGGAADRAQPPPGRLRHGGRVLRPVPGYNATIPRDCAPFPRILQENGYLTGGFGKWHLTPDNQQGFSGPFDRWPTRLGFDYFWGFLGGEAGQYDPLIAENQKIIGVPEAKDGEPYYFQDDLADKTIDWLHRVRSEKPETPWFAYVATGCSHAPHHVPRRVVGQVPRHVRPGLGRDARGDVRAAEGARRRPRRRGAAAAQRRVPDLGLARRDAQAPLRPSDGGLRGLLRERRLEHRPDHRRDRRRWASSTTPS